LSLIIHKLKEQTSNNIPNQSMKKLWIYICILFVSMIHFNKYKSQLLLK